MRALYYDANDEQQGECKDFSIVIAAIFIVGIGALAYTQMASPSSNSGTSTIGVIDTSRMLSQDNPIYISAAQEYMSYQSQLQQNAKLKLMQHKMMLLNKKIAEEARQNLAKKIKKLLNPFKIKLWRLQKRLVMLKVLALL